MNTNKLKGSPFDAGVASSGEAWNENVWTNRLIKSLPEYLDSKWQAFDSLNFTFEEIQFICLPDAILTKATGPTSVVTSVIGDDESDESCHFVLESKRQARIWND